MRNILIISMLMAFALGGCRASDRPDGIDSASAETDSTEYTLEEDIGAMLLVGFRGTAIDQDHHIVRDLSQYHVGSVILFDYDAPSRTRGRNITDAKQLQMLCDQLRSYNPDLLIGIDQEGGYVSRLSTRYGFPHIMSAQRSAELGDDTVRRYAQLTAEQLEKAGINLNFAPVADVNVNPKCPVIGAMKRSFSSDTKRVADCCRIWIEEQRKKGIISCLKHFPGHGSARGDTHQGLVDVSSTWQRCELEPYRTLVAENAVDMVMTAHVINRTLDPQGLPASLSGKITSLLRDSIGFKGVIVTDDLAMGAITQHYTMTQYIRMAIDAGADLLCLSNNGGSYNSDLVPQVAATILKLVNEGEVSRERIRQSADRVRRLQQKK